MIKVTFKNVGQGDSIILEWERNKVKKVAIIDCKRNEGSNPVLEHIIAADYREIEFLLLTHPHADHFSGFLELVEYCLNNNIHIGHFLHTSAISEKEYWKSSVTTPAGLEYMRRLYALLHNAYMQGKLVINNVEGETMNPHVNFTADLSMYIMAPTHAEIHKWYNDENPGYDEEEPGNKPSVNYLSTIIKIYAKDWYALLTSDVDKSVLKYYDTKKPEALKGKLVLAQSPHHGSDKNHNNTFWKKRIADGQKIPIVFSVGKNTYGHPAKITVDFFGTNGFELFATNQVGALTKFADRSKENSEALDIHSSAISTKKDRFNGDKTFEIDMSGLVRLV